MTFQILPIGPNSKRRHPRCLRLPIVALIFMLAGTGCQTIAPSPQTIAPPVPTLPPLPIQSTAIGTSPLYQTAIATARTATQLSQQAKSVEDWQAVVIQWQTAVNLMQKIPENDVNRTAALKNLVILEEGVARSKAKLKEFQVQSSEQKSFAPTQIIPAKLSSKPIATGSKYQAAIKSYRNNIPIIDVMFNGSVSFEMMVDTGASNTMITESMSKILQVKAVRSVPAKTPSGEVEFQVGYVDSIGIGDNSVEGLPVAIGTEALLGHDFFGDCNINIKRDENIVEFSQCKSDQTKKR